MRHPRPSRFLLLWSILLVPLLSRGDDAPATMNLAPADALANFKPSDSSVTVAAGDAPGSVAVTIQPGAFPFPGVKVISSTGTYDLSAYGYVEAHVTNSNTTPLSMNLRVDNSQHGAYWISEAAKIAPGQSGTLRVYFTKPADAFDPAKITEVLLFTGKAVGAPISFRIDSLVAGGKPGDMAPVLPADVRVVPKDGVIYGDGTPIEPGQLSGKNGGLMTFANGELKATLGASAGPDAVALLKPVQGAWDLKDDLEVHVTLKNSGTSAVTPQVFLGSTYGPTDTVAATAPVDPGATTEIVVPFAAIKPWSYKTDDEKALPTSKNITEGSGNAFLSNSTLNVGISTAAGTGDRQLTVTSIRADLPPTPELPDWVGKRPPVDGDWVKTFDDEFDGDALDATKWNVKGDNWYDKIVHYSKDNVLVGGGFMRIRNEKKTGFHNDDPTQYQTDFASGYLDTFDKFAQRYGYFESRMKLPKAAGLWPAFWLMPDRPGNERKGVRGSTADGGMEFDILEHLSVWGPYRYNIAMHWDGYGKDHKATGSKIYFQPDKDGFVTAGLLWTPGSAVYYANGREVLRLESPRVASVPEMMMFTVPIGGWDGNHLDPKAPGLGLPDDLVVDYVRVYQRKDLASDADTVNATAPAPAK
jgi:beta-glucanase (GH16 family)